MIESSSDSVEQWESHAVLWESSAVVAAAVAQPYFYLSISVIGACSISHVTVSTRDRLSRPSLIPVDARETALVLGCKFTRLRPADECCTDTILSDCCCEARAINLDNVS